MKNKTLSKIYEFVTGRIDSDININDVVKFRFTPLELADLMHSYHQMMVADKKAKKAKESLIMVDELKLTNIVRDKFKTLKEVDVKTIRIYKDGFRDCFKLATNKEKKIILSRIAELND